MSKKFSIAILILSVIGVLDTAYLTAEFLSHGQVGCSIVSGCNEVLGSSYSHIGPVPISGMGFIYYMTITVTAGLFVQTSNPKFVWLLFWLTGIGLLVSLGLVYLQVFVIGAVCLYCMASASITFMLFLIAQYKIRNYN